jgi:hypothetical protein
VAHQTEIEGQLARRQALEHRQHVAAAGRVAEVVGVLDAAFDRLEPRQGADVERLDQAGGGLERNLGEDRHPRGIRS